MKTTEIIKRMHNQELYICDDPTIHRLQKECLDAVHTYNQLPPSKTVEKKKMLKEMFASIGDNCYIETPFYANWGGKYVHLGHHVYANFNLTLVDDCEIRIGNYVMFGPNVTLTAGTHPVSPSLRAKEVQYNLPIVIADRVWIGANCVVLPGVTIGKNSIIGAGSVVTKDIPANVVAVGAPCRVLRKITAEDERYYDGNRIIDIE